MYKSIMALLKICSSNENLMANGSDDARDRNDSTSIGFISFERGLLDQSDCSR